mmetsp:Transcript_1628/g.2991  ORF Transcript_1628/g.2991 Transcript_1628/m.2991 type:complete len:338 (-) Transcript_1628:33-1046(-)
MRSASSSSSTGVPSFGTLARRSEDSVSLALLKRSIVIYSLSVIAMAVYVVLCSTTKKDDEATSLSVHIACVKALPCLLLSLNSFFRYFALRKNRFLFCLSIAFIFHAIGDFLLDMDQFTVGLASFLLAHVCNLLAFSCKADEEGSCLCCRSSSDHSETTLHTSLTPIQQDEEIKRNFLRINLALPFILYYVCFMVVLIVMGPGSGGEKLIDDPVMLACVLLYGMVLASCPWRALVRARHCFFAENRTIWSFVTAGYFIYALSDSTLAIDKFASQIPEPIRTISVMATYWVAQLLISFCCDVEICSASLIMRFFKPTARMKNWSGERKEDLERGFLKK